MPAVPGDAPRRVASTVTLSLAPDPQSLTEQLPTLWTRDDQHAYGRRMNEPRPPVELIDAEFTVISDGRPELAPEPTPSTWSFWDDDLPAVGGLVLGMIAVAAVGAFFRAIHWYG